MDKKKIKELIEEAKHLAILRKYENRQTYLNNCICCLKEALEELSKSDWVSVEDGLPPKNVVVRVCNKQNPNDLVLAYRTSKETMKIVYPNNVAMYTITHWCKIEKLED